MILFFIGLFTGLGAGINLSIVWYDWKKEQNKYSITEGIKKGGKNKRPTSNPPKPPKKGR